MIRQVAPCAVGAAVPLLAVPQGPIVAAPDAPRHAAAPKPPLQRGPQAVGIMLERLPPTYRVQLTAMLRHLDRWRETVLLHPALINDEVLEALWATAAVYLSRIRPCFLREAARVGPLWVTAAVCMALRQQLEESEGTWRSQARQFDVIYEAAMLQAHRRGHGAMDVQPYADQTAAFRPDALWEPPPPLEGLGRALLFHRVLNGTLQPYEVLGDGADTVVCEPTVAERSTWVSWGASSTLPVSALNVHFGPFLRHAHAHALARSWLHLIRFAEATGYHDVAYRERRKPSPGRVIERRFLHAIGHELQISPAEQQAAVQVLRGWCDAPETAGSSVPDADVEVFAGYLVKTLVPAAVRRCGWLAQPAAPLPPPRPRPAMRRMQTAAYPQLAPSRPQKSLLRSQSTGAPPELLPQPPLSPSVDE